MVTSKLEIYELYNIINLRKLITKGARYTELSTIYWDKAKPSIVDWINEAVEQLSNKLGVNKLQFSEWENAILNHIDFQISKLEAATQRCS